MASLSNAAQTALWQYLFNNMPWAALTGTLYVSLHTQNPGEAGAQSTYETTYSNYVRVAVPASAGTLLVSQNNPVKVQNIQTVSFPACGPTGDVLTYWGLGLSAASPGTLVTSGPLVTSAGAYGFTGSGSLIYAPQLPGILPNALVMFYAVGPGSLLPGGIVEGTLYYVGTTINGGAGGFTLSTTPNNVNPVQFGYAGSGMLAPCQPMTVVPNIAPTFPPGNLVSYLG